MPIIIDVINLYLQKLLCGVVCTTDVYLVDSYLLKRSTVLNISSYIFYLPLDTRGKKGEVSYIFIVGKS